jgi:hypothetical protein
MGEDRNQSPQFRLVCVHPSGRRSIVLTELTQENSEALRSCLIPSMVIEPDDGTPSVYASK